MNVKKLIIIVEDDIATRKLLAFKLKNAGFDTIDYNTADELIDFFDGGNLCDLIILDLMLPKMSGTEALMKIKTDKFTMHVPIIILSAKVLERDVIKNLEFGATDYIKKPFSPSELIARVKSLLKYR